MKNFFESFLDYMNYGQLIAVTIICLGFSLLSYKSVVSAITDKKVPFKWTNIQSVVTVLLQMSIWILTVVFIISLIVNFK